MGHLWDVCFYFCHKSTSPNFSMYYSRKFIKPEIFSYHKNGSLFKSWCNMYVTDWFLKCWPVSCTLLLLYYFFRTLNYSHFIIAKNRKPQTAKFSTCWLRLLKEILIFISTTELSAISQDSSLMTVNLNHS